jgi:FAD:protein FMN transferase
MKLLYTFFITFSLVITSCKEEEFYQIEGETQGTTYHMTYQGEQKQIKRAVDSILQEFDLSLSTYQPNSIISNVNRGNHVYVDQYFKDMFNKAKIVTEQSNGAFDITVGPLIDIYGFGSEKKDIKIDSALIDSILQYVGMDKVKLVNDTLIKDNILIQLSANAIAQGQAVDVICTYFESLGIENYLVEIGGEVRTKGLKKGMKWNIGIDKPFEGNNVAGENLQAVLAITDKSLATSGNYRQYYIKDGIKYTHTINPKTGYPSFQNILSATIIADDCITADAYATACVVMGFEESIKLLARNPELDAYFVYSDRETGEVKIYMTKAVEDMVVN